MNEHDDLPKISGYVSVKEAANMLNISDKMVYFYIENKRLSAVRAADVILIPVQEIEAFERKGVGRARVNTPKWRISTKDNVLSSTAIYVRIKTKSQDVLLQKLEEIRRGGKYDFPGTVARYIIGYESSPDEIEILLIWKSSVMPDETERERHLETFRKALVDVLDWETARYEYGVVYMHT